MTNDNLTFGIDIYHGDAPVVWELVASCLASSDGSIGLPSVAGKLYIGEAWQMGKANGRGMPAPLRSVAGEPVRKVE